MLVPEQRRLRRAAWRPRDVDALDFLRSGDHRQRAGRCPGPFGIHCPGFHRLQGAAEQERPATRNQALQQFRAVADFRLPQSIRAGEPARFECILRGASDIAERLWDFGDSIPEVTAQSQHTFDQPGNYRVTLIVWDQSGRGGRAEKIVRVSAQAVPQVPGLRQGEMIAEPYHHLAASSPGQLWAECEVRRLAARAPAASTATRWKPPSIFAIGPPACVRKPTMPAARRRIVPWRCFGCG